MSSQVRLLVAALGLAFLIAHLRALPRTLEDIDSINFAMGVEQFDVAAHQPHPPGYPVFIALAKISTRAAGVLVPSWDRDRRAAVGLAIWGVVAGALAAFVLTEFWMAAGLTPLIAFLAALVTVSSPLFWLTASRPLTDVTGLVAALAVQVLLIRGWRRISDGTDARLPRIWLWGATAAGLAVGIRSQTMWQTGPILAWVIGGLLIRRRPGDAVRTVAAGAAGVLVWAVPLVWLSGGLGAYLEAVRAQGAQDLGAAAGDVPAELFVNLPSWRLFKIALARTFVEPWQLQAIANAVLGLALVGGVRLALRARGVLGMIALGFWPFLVFHILIHETITLRYGLPMVVPIAALAVIGLATFGTRVATLGAVVIAGVSLGIVQPRLAAYAEDGAPVFRALQDMQQTLPRMTSRPLLRMHHQVWWGVRRPIEWYKPFHDELWDAQARVHPGKREWQGLVTDLVGGGTWPIWYLTDLRRNDIVLFDRRGRSRAGPYVLNPAIRRLVGGSRLDGLDWWTISQPFWMLGSGWSLSPEITGMTTTDGRLPHQQPAEGWLLRRGGPARLMIGGRYLRGNVPALVRIDLEGRPLAQWMVTSSPAAFVQWIDLPDGVPAGATPYAPFTVSVNGTDPSRPPPVVSLEQFDAASATDAIAAFTDGWYQPEENPDTGQSWRWASDCSTIVIRGVTKDLSLTISGESPLRDFDRAPTVIVRAGTRELARFSPAAAFVQTVALPRAALDAAEGRVTIETDLTFVPAERGQGADRRRLGLRLYRADVN